MSLGTIIAAARGVASFVAGAKGKAIAYVVAIIVVICAVWYVVDDYHFKPIREAENNLEVCKTQLLGSEQEILSLHNMLSKSEEENNIGMSECEQRLIECETDREYKNEKKLDTDSEHFYTDYAF